MAKSIATKEVIRNKLRLTYSQIYLDVKDISKNIGFSEQHTRRILRHLFSEEIIIRQDQKNGNGRPNHLYSHKKIN